MYDLARIVISKAHRNPTSPYENWAFGIQFMVSPDLGGVYVKDSSDPQLLVNMDTKRTIAKVSIGERDRSRARLRGFRQAL
jgi:hypothetical protein